MPRDEHRGGYWCVCVGGGGVKRRERVSHVRKSELMFMKVFYCRYLINTSLVAPALSTHRCIAVAMIYLLPVTFLSYSVPLAFLRPRLTLLRVFQHKVLWSRADRSSACHAPREPDMESHAIVWRSFCQQTTLRQFEFLSGMTT